jgi:AcrR family transcriptional regulator
MASSTRERILIAAAELFRRKGYTGTGLKEIVAAADAPFGSLYHHFPGGKEEVGLEVVRVAGGMYATMIPYLLAANDDLEVAIRDSFRLAGEHLEASGWQDACPIATIALEVASVNEPIRQATAEAFATWVEDCAELLRTRGLDEQAATTLGFALVTALEGAFVLARASRSVEPLERAGEVIAAQAGLALATAAEAPAVRG